MRSKHSWRAASLGLLLPLLGCPPNDSSPETLACEAGDRCEGEFCEQVLIPAGEFLMGSDDPPRVGGDWTMGDARPAHAVYLDAFCIDRYEVTPGRYEACVDSDSCSPEGLDWGGRDTETVGRGCARLQPRQPARHWQRLRGSGRRPPAGPIG